MMPSADAISMSPTIVGKKAAAAEAAARKAAQARQASRNQYRGSADSIARSPTQVGKAAAAAESLAIARANARNPQIYESADAISASPTLVGPEAAASELAAREAAVQRMAKPAIQYRTSGSGRSTGDVVGGGGGVTSAANPVYAPPAQIEAPPAAIQPPAIIAQAAPSETNVAGESFSTVGTPGSFGQYERRRTSRGPVTGLSVTPEMIRRAAAQRLG